MSCNSLLEETYGSILGHLYSKPYCETITTSTLNLGPKGNSQAHRIILDVSYSEAASSYPPREPGFILSF